LLTAALAGQVQVAPNLWRRLNAVWVVFYIVLGGLNLLVAAYASERMWVNFKVFGLSIITLAFLAIQVIWLTRRSETTQAEPSP
jgi:intracellular septation protein